MPIQTYYCSKCDMTFEVVSSVQESVARMVSCPSKGEHIAEWRPPTGVGMVMK